MARKKKTKNDKKTLELKKVLGSANIIRNEKLHSVIGVFLILAAVYLVTAFFSFFSTGAADQSLIEAPKNGEFLNEYHDFQNSCGSLGAYASWYFIKRCFGLPAFLIPLFMILLGIHEIKAYCINLLKWFLSLMILMIWSCITFAEFLTPLFIDACFCPGGDHGIYMSQLIKNIMGTPGLTAILTLVAIGFLTYLSAETTFIIRKILNPSKIFDKVKFRITNVAPNEPEESIEGKIEGEEIIKTSESTESQKSDMEMTIEIATGEEKGTVTKAIVNNEEIDPYDPKRDLENYRYPTLDLLKQNDNDVKPHIDMAEQNANKNRIVDVLRTFGIEIVSIKATVGPTVTLYELTPAPGVRIAKIRGLEDDIALSLKAHGIRIIAPIPLKGTIGVEVPNAKPSIVSMDSILNSKKFQESMMELPCAIGKTITNEVFIFDLAKAPHLLVAGATGQGKSVGLNAILTSLLYKKHPAELKIVLVDPKMVEFSIYRNISKHFLAALPEDFDSPIITDTSKVVRTLQSLCVEMDTRYELLMAAGERHITDYNKKFIARKLNPQNGHKFMPYIVVVIDEYGDLIMTAGKEIETPIARIAQKARAVGIHMIIATQRPTTTIITGNIKANFPARIAFRVSQGIDSKTILDRMGAQQLIGCGDMLYSQGNDPVRVQCAFVSTSEVVDVNNFISEQQGYAEPFELPEPILENNGTDDDRSKEVDIQHLDPFFEDAARLIVINQSGSTSLIQRKFAIGYNRAGRLMDQLERAGVVGAAMGSKPREVIIQDENSLNSLLINLRQDNRKMMIVNE